MVVQRSILIVLISAAHLESWQIASEGKNMSLEQWIVFGIFLLIAWAIASMPLWLAARLLTGGRATLGAAMLGMLLGGIVFAVVYLITYSITSSFTSSGTAGILALVLSFLAFLGLYRELFNVGWLRALAIAILAVVLAIVIPIIIAAILAALGLTLPALPFLFISPQ